MNFELISYTILQTISSLGICFGFIKYWTKQSAIAARASSTHTVVNSKNSISYESGDFFIYGVFILYNIFQSIFIVSAHWIDASESKYNFEKSDKYRITVILCLFVTNIVNVFVGLKSKSVYLFFVHYCYVSTVILIFFVQNINFDTSFIIIIIPTILEYLIIVAAIVYTNRIIKFKGMGNNANANAIANASVNANAISKTGADDHRDHDKAGRRVRGASDVLRADITVDSVVHLQYGSIVLFFTITIILMITLFESSRDESFILFIINCIVYGFCMFYIDSRANIHHTGPTYYWLLNLLYLQILFQTEYVVCIASFILLIIVFGYYFKYKANVPKWHLYSQIMFMLSINFLYSFFTKYVNYWELEYISTQEYNIMYLLLLIVSFWWILAMQMLNKETHAEVTTISGNASLVKMHI